MKKPELLAPAGTLQALKAAVYAGADAVYFGCSSYNARAFAGNFEGAELDEAFRICRAYGVKAHITLNTLLSNSELSDVLKLVEVLEDKYKPDAYIIQDLGLIATLKERFPLLPIHASTQMQIHSSKGIKLLKSLGVSRVVYARELSKDNIKAAVNAELETEIFAHGAICVCASGGCLMSSAIGGRSGNRGECAQPCRQMYNGKYPLSLKDMCLAEHIPEICELGVDCIKLEGRMKSPEYVYEVTSVYRKLIDDCRKPNQNEIKRLLNIFSRSGFTDGYFTGNKADMFGVRTESDKEKSREQSVDIMRKKLNAKISCYIKKGKPICATASSGETQYTAKGPVPEFAINRPFDKQSLAERLEKSGTTIFNVQASVELDDGLILPISAINALRRDALNGLENMLIEGNTPNRLYGNRYTLEMRPTVLPYFTTTVARFEGSAPSETLLRTVFEKCDRVDLPLWAKLPIGINTEKISLVLPRIIYDSETHEIEKLITQARQNGFSQLTVPNLSFLPFCEGFTVHGDYPLNVTNVRTASVLHDMGFADLCVSPEQRLSSVASSLQMSYIAYGRMPLMHTDNCIIKNCRSCKNETKCKDVLKDKTGAEFPIIREFKHRNTLYNSVPTYLLDRPELFEGFTKILMFTTETDEEILDILNHGKVKGEFTRGAYKKKGGVFK